MNFFVAVGIYLAVVGFGMAVFLLGKSDGNSVFDRVYRAATEYVPNAIKFVLRILCCGSDRGGVALDSAWNYTCNEANPIVQIVYLSLVVGGYFLYVIFGYPLLPNTYLGEYHKYVGFLVFVLCIYTFAAASITDPGIITKRNVHAISKIYPMDEILFHEKECSTCKQPKPARSKHCSLCNCCVARFDHHCVWINNCVGVNNVHWFIAFLLANTALCVYGAIVGVISLMAVVKERDLWNARFINPTTGEQFTASYRIIFQWLLTHEYIMIAMITLCTIMSIVLVGFTSWHLYLAASNVTTNESAKWRTIHDYLKKENREAELDGLKNIYDKGSVLANWRDVLWDRVDTRTLAEEPSNTGEDNSQVPQRKSVNESGRNKKSAGRRRKH
ncbi:zinc finger protein [Perkinsus olseni]|uniref:Palmitoyltransferase n=3 Tax=Perkinsus olseni TaxID=32597 RepID=A0A7J6PD87_PEROL|nr:zinc finger protein [Perkinsus olseni]